MNLATIFKYIRYIEYFKYLPLLQALIQLIRQAEGLRDLKGAEKREQVTELFTNVIDAAVASNLIKPELADTITGSIGAVIDVIVQIMNAAGGVPPLGVVTPQPE